MWSSKKFWSLHGETLNLKHFLLLSLLLTRISHVIGRSSSSKVHEDLLLSDSRSQQQSSNTHHSPHHHRHHQHQHQHRHHHGGTYYNEVTLDQLLIPNQQMRPGKLESRANHHPHPPMKSDKPCASCATLDKDLFIKLKLEAIKNQILSKLHLDGQPNITSRLPNQMVLGALLESKSVLLNRGDLPSSILSTTSYQSSPSSSSSNPLDTQGSINQPLSSQSHLHHPHPHPEKSHPSNSQSNHLNDSSEPGDDYYGTTSEIISFPEPGNQINGHTLLEFTLPSSNVDLLDVKSAILWVQVDPWDPLKGSKKFMENHQISLFVFAVRDISNHSSYFPDGFPSDGSSSTEVKFEQVVMRKISASPGWRQVNLTSEIQRWFASRRSKLTLMIDCSGCEGKVRFSLFDSYSPESSSSSSTSSSEGKPLSKNSNPKPEGKPKGWKWSSSSNPKVQHLMSSSSSPSSKRSQLRPYIIIQTKPKTLKRMKRDYEINCDPNFKHCCVQKFYVDFKKLGWDDWIIAPNGFYANYCAGDCTLPVKTPEIFAFYHSYIMDTYNRTTSPKDNPYASVAPCCTPTILEPVELLYSSGNSFVRSVLPNLRVKACGCA